MNIIEAETVMVLSGKILRLIEEWEDMTQSDLQACIEAIIIEAIDTGKLVCSK